MKFNDEGIIINQKNYGENSLIVKVFSKQHGAYRGFVRSAKSKKNNTIFQIGNLISFEFRSRIEENLGQFFLVDLAASYCSKIIFDKLKINCVSSLFSMLDTFFLERENHEALFFQLENFLQKISKENISNKVIIADYVRLELEILRHLGYGLDLSSCAATNSTTNLTFVSPKSARAVSSEAGKPYQSKLLRLPEFLISNDDRQNDQDISNDYLLEGLNLSGFFLKKFLREENVFGNESYDFLRRDAILGHL